MGYICVTKLLSTKKSDLTIARHHFLSLLITAHCSLSTAVHVSVTCFTAFTARIVNVNMSDYDTSDDDDPF